MPTNHSLFELRILGEARFRGLILDFSRREKKSEAPNFHPPCFYEVVDMTGEKEADREYNEKLSRNQHLEKAL